jgi:hypothetical protein
VNVNPPRVLSRRGGSAAGLNAATAGLQPIRVVGVSATLCVAFLAVTPTVASAEEGHRPYCHPRHARTLKANGKVRVYSLPLPFRGRSVWACLYSSGKRHFLGDHDPGLPTGDDGEAVSPVRLRGALGGWEYRTWDHYGGGSYKVAVWNARTGKLIHSTSQSGDGTADIPAWSSDNFVMDRAGSVAWIAIEDGYTSWTYHMFESDTTKGARLLDSGTSIDPKSLKRHGEVVSWRNGKETRTARFVR